VHLPAALSPQNIRPMCGRYPLFTSVDDLRRSFSFTRQRPNLEPRFNTAPTQTVTIARLAADGGRELALVR
jgi:putative SOS response-associated peptidase YedK